MVDTQRLNDRIDRSGLKKYYIASKIGLTTYGLQKKITNQTQFKANEIEGLYGINAMTSLLQYLYDDLDFHEYPLSETFEVTLKKDSNEITLNELEYNLLFDFLCSNIPNYINLIKSKTPTND